MKILLAAVLLLSGCALRPDIVTDTYAFDLPAPSAGGPRSSRAISVLPVTASPAAADQMFLYRVDEVRYESDFYNRFLAPPARLLTSKLRQWLAQSRAGEIRMPGSPLGADLVVQPRLTELYVDYRVPARPVAVMAMRIVLFREATNGPVEVFERTYRRAVPMAEIGPRAAAKAWSRGASGIFAEFTRDLRAES